MRSATIARSPPGAAASAAGPQDYIFGVEYSAIRWLEQNGYDVSYMAGMDSDRLGSLLHNHKMFLSVGHDEYWSGQQRANVEAARDAGVNLSFWSGNEVYWETRFAPSISAGAQPYRTLGVLQGDLGRPHRSDNQWTGTYRDPRFVSPTAIGGGRPGKCPHRNDVPGRLLPKRCDHDPVRRRQPAVLAQYERCESAAGSDGNADQNYLGYEWESRPTMASVPPA